MKDFDTILLEYGNAISADLGGSKIISKDVDKENAEYVAKKLIKAIINVVFAIRSYDRNYKTMSPSLRPAAYQKAIKELKEAIKAAEDNEFFKYEPNYWRVLKNTVNEPLPEDPRETELSRFYVNTIRKIRRDNAVNAKFKDFEREEARILVGNRSDIAQVDALEQTIRNQEKKAIKAYRKGEQIPKNQVLRTYHDNLDIEADQADKNREAILKGQEIDASKRELTADEKKAKYATGMNSGTAAKIENLKRWDDLNTGFKTNYALIQSWKSQGIKPDEEHKFYRVGVIDGNPVCYLGTAKQFFIANRNWWAGTRAKATSIFYTEPEYCSNTPSDEIKKKWETIKPKSSSVVTENVIFDY